MVHAALRSGRWDRPAAEVGSPRTQANDAATGQDCPRRQETTREPFAAARSHASPLLAAAPAGRAGPDRPRRRARARRSSSTPPAPPTSSSSRSQGDVYCRLPRGARGLRRARRCCGSPSGDRQPGDPGPAGRDAGADPLRTYQSDDRSAGRADAQLSTASPPTAGSTWSPPTVRVRQRDLRRGRTHARRAVAADAATRHARGERRPERPFTGGETRVLNLHDDPNADRHLARHDGAARRPRSCRPTATCRSRAGALFGGGDVYDPNAWATRGTVRRVFNGELVERPARDVPVRARAAGQPAPAAVPGAVLLPLLRRPPRALPPRPHRRGGPQRLRHLDGVPGRPRAPARGRRHHERQRLELRPLHPHRHALESWFGKTTVLFRSRDSARKPTAVRVGAAPDGRGVVVWQDRDQRLGHAAASGTREVPPAGQPERPAGLHRQHLRLRGRPAEVG